MGADEVLAAVRACGLLPRGRTVVAMLSGGRDSVCLLDVAARICGADQIAALHVNYGLRAAADDEQRHCSELCQRLGVELEVVRASRAPGQRAGANAAQAQDAPEREAGSEPAGNLQAWARELRYAEAERRAAERDALIAAGHTASDQVETILYRLAASPGRRALLGMPASEGRLIRPLLGLTREQTGAYCEERGLRWRDDASNEDQRYARSRVRHGLVGALRAVHPAAEANVLRTAELLRAETQLLDALVSEELAGRSSVAIERLHALPPALARMLVVRLAEQAAGTYVPQAGDRVEELIVLGRKGGRRELHLGGQAGAVIQGGVLEVVRLAPRAGASGPE